MSRRASVTLTPQQRSELLHLRRQHSKSYVRERAAAILQVADGKLIGEVVAKGLLKRRQDETVSSWIHRYLEEGAVGLELRAGRGRKPGKRMLGGRTKG